VSDEDLAMAKNLLKMHVLTGLENKEDRLEEMARNYNLFGELTFHKYID